METLKKLKEKIEASTSDGTALKIAVHSAVADLTYSEAVDLSHALELHYFYDDSPEELGIGIATTRAMICSYLYALMGGGLPSKRKKRLPKRAMTRENLGATTSLS